MTESESGVLPLHYTSIFFSERLELYYKNILLSICFLIKNEINLNKFNAEYFSTKQGIFVFNFEE